MGEFVAVSAFRSGNTDGVLAAVGRFFAANGWPAQPGDRSEPISTDDVVLFPSVDGWTVVAWPAHFTEVAAAAHVSRELGVVASTVSVYDGDYWRHTLLRDGVTLDRFASMPDYFTDDPEEKARLTARYAGDPVVVAEAVGCRVEQIAPYFVPVELADGEDETGYYVEEPAMGRAFPDDEYELDDPWVFVDFWRRLGPRYPKDPDRFAARLRLAPGWLGKLPCGDAEL